MSTIHFLNVLEGDCNIIQHRPSGRTTIMDICNGDSDGIYETEDLRRASYYDISERVTGNYGQKKYPENPITYLNKLGIETIWRFIVSHPDMDHLDGIRDLFADFHVANVWDTSNTKKIADFSSFGRYNEYDWEFYKKIRSESLPRHKYFKLDANKHNPGNYWSEDDIKILGPTAELVDAANKKDDFNDASYVLLYTPPVGNTGKRWKILFAGDSHDNSWAYILDKFLEDVMDVDILIAPHHGRDSDRSFEFIKTLNPRITLFGNASSKHLAYGKYPNERLTNNQAGSVIIDCSDQLNFYVKNEAFRNAYWNSKGWINPPNFDPVHNAYYLYSLTPR